MEFGSAASGKNKVFGEGAFLAVRRYQGRSEPQPSTSRCLLRKEEARAGEKRRKKRKENNVWR